MNRYRVKQGNR
jgi:hypothetical protein